MSQVVQAKCPHCQNMLRIPTEWIARPMKCKHCSQIFQAMLKAPSPAPAPQIPPAKKPAQPVNVATKTPLPPMLPPGHPGLQFENAAGRPASTRRKSGLWKGLLLLVVVSALAAGVFLYARPHLSNLFATKGDDEQKRIAEGKKDKVEPIPKIEPKEEPKKELPKAEPKIEPKVEPKKEPPKVEPKIEPKVEPKKEPPKVEPKIEPKKKDPPPVAAGLFPRRALLINISNYVLFNPLQYGRSREDGKGNNKFPGSSTGVLTDTLTRAPLNIPATQITELSDTGRNAFSTSKSVLENAIADFTETSRDQDRILILFTGHAIEIEKEAYLIPVEGSRDDVKTLIPLSWVYDKLAKCKARQKLLILDVFRYPPARGEELPGTGDMTEDFDAKLLAPPAGVQVWASCIKEQKSIELESGSAFMTALCTALQERLPGIQEPTDPLPLEHLVPKVNQKLKDMVAPQKVEQLSRLSGTHVEEGGTAYDPNVPLPPKLALKATATGGESGAGLDVVRSIMDEINQLPPARSTQKPLEATSLPTFSAKVLDAYKADYKSWTELEDMAKDKEKYPLRAAVLEAIRITRDSQKIKMRETLFNPGGQISAQIKAAFLKDQSEPGVMIFEMEKVLADMKAAAEMRDKESSKRWQANFDYALARLQSRLVFIYEYNNLLAQVRGDSLPALEGGQNGWRVGSRKKVQINEPKVKDMVKNIEKTWKRLAEENSGTPWAVLAQRERMSALGLEWRATKD